MLADHPQRIYAATGRIIIKDNGDYNPNNGQSTRGRISMEDLLKKQSGTIVKRQDTLFMIAHMRDVKTSQISMYSRRRNATKHALALTNVSVM